MKKRINIEKVSVAADMLPNKYLISDEVCMSVINYSNFKHKDVPAVEISLDAKDLNNVQNDKAFEIISRVKSTLASAKKAEEELSVSIKEDMQMFETKLEYSIQQLQENKINNADNMLEFTRRLNKDQKELKGAYGVLREEVIAYSNVEQSLKECEKIINKAIPKFEKVLNKEVIEKTIFSALDEINNLRSTIENNDAENKKTMSDLKSRYNQHITQAKLVKDCMLTCR